MIGEPRADRVYTFVKGRTKYLSKDSSSSRAMLAKLRRGAGKPLGAYPDAWGIVLDGLDEDMLSYDGEPSYAEHAIWTALTLYAVHQQGKQDQMSKEGNSFGAAVKGLILPDGSNEQSIRRRFDAVITAKDLAEVSHHARGLVQLFKASSIPLDYPKFAEDLYRLQFPDKHNKVLLRWGQDSYRKNNTGNETKEETTNGQ